MKFPLVKIECLGESAIAKAYAGFKGLSVLCIAVLALCAAGAHGAESTPSEPPVPNATLHNHSDMAASVVPVKANAPATDPADITNAPLPGLESAESKTGAAPPLGALPLNSDIKQEVVMTNAAAASAQDFQIQLDLAREQRRAKNTSIATKTLVSILQTNAPPEFKRLSLFELALVAQDSKDFVRAQQIFSQYAHLYQDDASIPEVLLRQGLLYREMGVTTLAISKFYAVMSSALKLKLDNLDYYKKLVLQSQTEIADTYYLEGKYSESADFFSRLAKADSPDLNKTLIQYKLIRSLSYLPDQNETIAKSQMFLETHTNSSEVPEVRFILASALKKIGRNQDSMKQVLLLLQSQHENVQKNPEVWIYWQQRAGNEIANQLYKEGDYLNALEIYSNLSDLDKSPAWQLPVWYQVGLVYEQLKQWEKATGTYQKIVDRQNELTGDKASPSLKQLLEMARWRKDYIGWMEKARTTNQSFERSSISTASAPPPPPVVAEK